MQVVILEVDNPSGLCMAVENVVSCVNVNDPGLPVCTWGNVILQPCTPQGETSTLDQQWVYDNSTGAVLAVGTSSGLAANLCLTLCQDRNPANGACSLVDNNVGVPPRCISCRGGLEN